MGQRAKDDTGTRIIGLVTCKRKALNWRADISSVTRLYETFSGDPIILFRNNEDKGVLQVPRGVLQVPRCVLLVPNSFRILRMEILTLKKLTVITLEKIHF